VSRTATHEKIIVALDGVDLPGAGMLVETLAGSVGAFKVGKELFTAYGPEAVRMVKNIGARVFLDLKYHDIPVTVARAVRQAARLGVRMLTVHTLGGPEMMQQAARAVREAEPEEARRPLLLGVTVLTSLSQPDLQTVGFMEDTEKLVIRLARLAQKSGMDGVVASPQEIGLVKQACGADFLVVTPGIRPDTAPADDQKRTMTPAEALRAGADFLVVGRPVTQSPDPLSVVMRMASGTE